MGRRRFAPRAPLGAGPFHPSRSARFRRSLRQRRLPAALPLARPASAIGSPGAGRLPPNRSGRVVGWFPPGVGAPGGAPILFCPRPWAAPRVPRPRPAPASRSTWLRRYTPCEESPRRARLQGALTSRRRTRSTSRGGLSGTAAAALGCRRWRLCLGVAGFFVPGEAVPGTGMMDGRKERRSPQS